MVGKSDLEVFPPETAKIYFEEESPILENGIPLLNKIDPYFKADGSPGWVSTNKWPMFDADGKTVIGIFGISRDVTESKHREDELRVMASTDFLTGVASRRTFIGDVEYEIARMRRDATVPCAILMFDLGEMRKVDRMGRLGGEEFAILMPAADLSSAKIFAERLRQQVKSTPMCVDGQSITVTVSIGLSEIDASDQSSSMALERIDRSLYKAKNNGRNRVEISDSLKA